jgi:hypothetical protein
MDGRVARHIYIMTFEKHTRRLTSQLIQQQEVECTATFRLGHSTPTEASHDTRSNEPRHKKTD